jgi:hypothetical protein
MTPSTSLIIEAGTIIDSRVIVISGGTHRNS